MGEDQGQSKWVRAMKKKYREVLELKERFQKGESLLPAQEEKIQREENIRAELLQQGIDPTDLDQTTTTYSARAGEKRKSAPKSISSGIDSIGENGMSKGKGKSSKSGHMNKPFDVALTMAIRRTISDSANSTSEIMSCIIRADIPRIYPDISAYALYSFAKRDEEHMHAPAVISLSEWPNFASAIAPMIQQLRARDLSKAMYSTSKLIQVARNKQKSVDSEKSASTSTTLIAALFKRVSDEDARKVSVEDAVDARGAAMIIHAAAHLSGKTLRPDEQFRRAMEKILLERHSDLNLQDLANTLWGLAKLRWSVSGGLLGALRGILAKLLSPRLDIKAQEAAMAMWALGTMAADALSAQNLPLLGALGLDLMRRVVTESEMARFTTQGVSNVAWGLAKLMLHTEVHIDARHVAILGSAAQQEGYSSQGLANVMVSLVRLGAATESLEALLTANTSVIGSATASDVADLAWALAQGKLYTGSAGRKGVAFLKGRSRELGASLDWAAIAHLDQLRVRVGKPPWKFLRRPASKALEAVATARHNRDAAVAKELLAHVAVAGAEGVAGVTRVLLANDSAGAMRGALRARLGVRGCLNACTIGVCKVRDAFNACTIDAGSGCSMPRPSGACASKVRDAQCSASIGVCKVLDASMLAIGVCKVRDVLNARTIGVWEGAARDASHRDHRRVQ
ncbi:hypothetical protein CYMTET_29612, partial [Cymbomonas tetramitiformis]